ncbi:MAG: branched-chain amino acid ABC transporter permease [Chloroflexi bacterium]|nr:branched-chain amino acid ABC transporter permease [Chloroflexota bacterium]MBV9598716.1 branched-chain amino acid ABC transporter permease [Chloroflexota bacterium]
MNQVILQLLNGLVVGSSLALVAAGLALLFGVLHIINFAQGDFFMMGGYAVWFSLNLTHNYVAAMVIGTVVVAIGGGLLLTAVIWPLLQRSAVLVLLATLGLSLILEQGATNLLGGDTKLVPPPLTLPIPIGPVLYPAYDLVVIAAGMGILLLGYFFLRYTRYGIWLRAVAQNRPMAAALGVPVPRVYVLAFMVSAGLAALAGGLLLPLQSVYPTIGNDVIANAFIIVVAGGLGNFRGAAIVALLVGEFQALGQLIPGIKPSVLTLALFGLVIVLLMVRAQRQHSVVRL